MSGAAAPLVLTLELDGESFAALDALRRRFYPPERNFVPAHVTLFRNLPGERKREIRATAAAFAAKQRMIDVAAGEVRALERGVALFLRSAQLHALRAALAREWWPWLGDEDRMDFRPHVTLQLGVSPAEAERTRREIGAPNRLPPIRGIGLHLWRYREGPWESEGVYRFR